jgi:uncharacterized protein
MEHIKNHEKVKILLAKTDEFLENIGYTEHGTRHVELVSRIAHNIMVRLDYPMREQKLAEIAGYLHDIGNAVNRMNHAQTGAVLAYHLLTEMNFKMEDIVDICGAIGNHHEVEGKPISAIAAALIIADKTDVHKTRVRKNANVRMDIHDRVNWAVEKSFLNVNRDKRVIALELTIDAKISSVMEYFEIFLERMLLSRKAAEFLGCQFEMYVNGNKIL